MKLENVTFISHINLEDDYYRALYTWLERYSSLNKKQALKICPLLKYPIMDVADISNEKLAEISNQMLHSTMMLRGISLSSKNNKVCGNYEISHLSFPLKLNEETIFNIPNDLLTFVDKRVYIDVPQIKMAKEEIYGIIGKCIRSRTKPSCVGPDKFWEDMADEYLLCAEAICTDFIPRMERSSAWLLLGEHVSKQIHRDNPPCILEKFADGKKPKCSIELNDCIFYTERRVSVPNNSNNLVAYFKTFYDTNTAQEKTRNLFNLKEISYKDLLKDWQEYYDRKVEERIQDEFDRYSPFFGSNDMAIFPVLTPDISLSLRYNFVQRDDMMTNQGTFKPYPWTYDFKKYVITYGMIGEVPPEENPKGE